MYIDPEKSQPQIAPFGRQELAIFGGDGNIHILNLKSITMSKLDIGKDKWVSSNKIRISKIGTIIACEENEHNYEQISAQVIEKGISQIKKIEELLEGSDKDQNPN